MKVTSPLIGIDMDEHLACSFQDGCKMDGLDRFYNIMDRGHEGLVVMACCFHSPPGAFHDFYWPCNRLSSSFCLSLVANRTTNCKCRTANHMSSNEWSINFPYAPIIIVTGAASFGEWQSIYQEGEK